MINYLTDNDLDFETGQTEAIALTSTSMQQAIQLSRKIPNPKRQWQAYFNILGLFAFTEWVAARVPKISINPENSSILQPQYAHIIEGVCNLQIGDFKICLLAVGSLTDDEIYFPRPALEIPEFTAHFYVVVEVLEEIATATILGFMRYDQLIERFRQINLLADPDWTYPLPWNWFNDNIDDLLLYFRCLESRAIILPDPPVRRPVSLSAIQAKLFSILPALKSGEVEIWQLISWEQATEILTNLPLLNWLHQELISVNQTPNLTQKILNVGLWLRDEIDDLARELSWVLLPAFNSERLGLAGATAMRSSIEELEAIVTQLERRGTAISPAARGACKNFNLASITLRLYALSWPLLSTENIPEWKLLLILGGSPTGTHLPNGVKIQVSDNDSLLVEQVLSPNTIEPYLYSLVVGTWDEQFTVTITLNNGVSLTLPPFAFRPQ
jgi:hypothetical protein